MGIDQRKIASGVALMGLTAARFANEVASCRILECRACFEELLHGKISRPTLMRALLAPELFVISILSRWQIDWTASSYYQDVR